MTRMRECLQSLKKPARRDLVKRSHPRSIHPMKASLVENPFSSPEWVFERKLDGERCILHRNGKEISLRSRNGKEKRRVYPEIATILESLSGDFILDSEIVTFSGSRTSFKKLQQRIQHQNPDRSLKRKVPVVGYAFDILYLDGYSLVDLPLRERKKLLKSVVGKSGFRFLNHRNNDGESFFREACQRGWEGIIAKKADSIYEQKRSRQWLKVKCSRRQEFVVAGFTDPSGERQGFGALLLGYHDQGGLRYAGRVGTGFDDAFLHRFRKDLDGVHRDHCPFEDFDESPHGVHWVQPVFVAEVDFTEWTDAGKLRHPRFLGLRDDKNPEDVTKEIIHE